MFSPLRLGDSSSRENEPRLAGDGFIHHAVPDRTYALTVDDEDLARFGYLWLRWCQDRIDDCNLRRGGRRIAMKAEALRRLRLPLQAFRVSNVEIRRIQSRDPRGFTGLNDARPHPKQRLPGI